MFSLLVEEKEGVNIYRGPALYWSLLDGDII